MLEKIVCSDGITRWCILSNRQVNSKNVYKIFKIKNQEQDLFKELNLLKLELFLDTGERKTEFQTGNVVTGYKDKIEITDCLKPKSKNPSDLERKFENFLLQIHGKKFLLVKNSNFSVQDSELVSSCLPQLIFPLERFAVILYFLEEWRKGSVLIHGKENSIFGKEILGKTKISKILRASRNCVDFKIPIDLLIAFHFLETENLHSKPNLNKISEIPYIKKFQKWIVRFSSLAEARKSVYPEETSETFEAIIEKDHERFLSYKKSSGMTDRNILKLHAMEFNPFYLLSYPEFQDEYRENPEILAGTNKKNYEEAKAEIRDPRSIHTFSQMMRDLKCNQKSNRM